MKSIVFFALVLAVAFSTEDVFAEIRKSDFGSTLTQTIELQLKTSDNIVQVTKMVEKVKKGLRKERDEASAAYKSISDSCTGDFSKFTSDLDSYQTTKTKNERLVQVDGPQLASRLKEQSNRQSELANRQNALKNRRAENARRVKEFHGALSEHAAVKRMMIKARKIMQEAFRHKGEFLQLKATAFAKLSTHIKAFKPLKEQGISHGYAQIFNVIAMIAERAQSTHPTVADSSLVDTVLRIFDDIEENLQTSLDIEKKAEANRVAAFKDVEARLEGQISDLNDSLAKVAGQILKLKFEIGSYEAAIDAAQQDIDGVNTLFTARKVACGNEDKSFQAKYDDLSNQIRICGHAVYLMKEKRELLERYRH
jgi:hypothetical protein